jgi:hypothetical protein
MLQTSTRGDRMQRLFGWSALAGALLALATPAAAQEQPPVTIALAP